MKADHPHFSSAVELAAAKIRVEAALAHLDSKLPGAASASIRKAIMSMAVAMELVHREDLKLRGG